MRERAVLSTERECARRVEMKDSNMFSVANLSNSIGLVLISLPVGSGWCAGGQQAE